MKNVALKKTIVIFFAVLLFGVISSAAEMQVMEIPTAHTLRRNDGNIVVWSNLSGFSARAYFSHVENLDFFVTLKGRPNYFQVFGGAKWQFLKEGDKLGALAIGTDSIYVVMSYGLAPGTYGHIGVGAGDVSTVFAGLDYVVNLGSGAPPVKVMVEYNNGLNFGFSAEVAPALSVGLAIKNLDRVSLGATVRFAL